MGAAVLFLFIGVSAGKGGAEGAAPGFAGEQNGGGGLFLPADTAAFGAGDAVPGLDANEPGHTGLAPDQCVGELGNVADDRATGVLFVNAQGGGAEIRHAVAVIGKEILVDGNGGQIAAQVVMILLQQSRGPLVETKGRLHLVESQLIVRHGVLAVKGNGKGGMIADAEG